MNWADTVMMIFEKIMFGVILNILWVLGVIMGLFVFGIAPATFSVSILLNEKELFEKNSKIKPIVFNFFKNYKKEFLKANLVFGLYAILFYLLIIDYNILQKNGVLYSILQIPLVALSLYTVGTFMFVIPVAVVSKGNFKQKFKLILATPVLMPLISFLNILIIMAMLFLAISYPVGTILIFIAAGIAAISFISTRALKRKALIVGGEY